MDRMKLRRTLLCLLLLAGIGHLAGAGVVYAQETAATLVGVDEVRYEARTQTATVIGRLVARQAGVVAARINGAVEEVRVHVGDRVAKGDILAVIQADRLRWQRDLLAAEVDESTAQIATAEAQLSLAQQQLDRLEGLRDSAAFSQSRYDDARQEVARARSVLREAEARRKRARANLEIAEIDLNHAEIKAPYPGVVTVRHTAPGAYLDVGAGVINLVNDRDLEIEADVANQQIGALSPGVVVSFSFDGERTHQAVVRALVPEENPLTRTRPVRFTPVFEADQHPLAANESVKLDLPMGQPGEALTVHKDAVIHQDAKKLVFLVDKADAVVPREVKLGEAIGVRFEVLEGLREGDLVVVRGNERLMPGQKVRYER